jgi:signal transduction histidine kinase
MTAARAADGGLQGISSEVVSAGACFAVSGGLVAVLLAQHPDLTTATLLLGWPVLALSGAVVLDQRPGSVPGRTLVVLGLAPVLLACWVVLRGAAEPLTSSATTSLATALEEVWPVPAVALGLALPWAACPGVPRRFVLPSAVAAVSGACTGPLAVLGVVPAGARVPGAVVAVAGTLGCWVLVVRTARRLARPSRRRVLLLVGVIAGAAAALVVARLAVGPGGAAALGGALLLVLGPGAARLLLAPELRPVDEYALDLGLAVGAAMAAGGGGLLVYELSSSWASSPAPATTAALTVPLAAAMAAAAATWVRRSLLIARYGTGTLSADDVRLITADLHAQTEPRALLGKAARMVADASGSREASIVLGSDLPEVPSHWTAHPLVVGGERVGSLALDAGGPEGPELRQRRVVGQLLPTVALVARAVALAVEAEHARRDLARRLEDERRRILGDLHDGLGPVLAGMSMQVRAALRTAPGGQAALLEDLAAGLAAGRTDLRRVVSGLTPHDLEDGDLGAALDRLVRSFGGHGTTGPGVDLTVDLPVRPSVGASTAVYRCVAEGLTNALRHAGPTSVQVRVGSTARCVRVEVADDGTGGPITPGVGLSSLEARARRLGGALAVHTRPAGGTVLVLEVPTTVREAG